MKVPQAVMLPMGEAVVVASFDLENGLFDIVRYNGDVEQWTLEKLQTSALEDECMTVLDWDDPAVAHITSRL